MVRNGYRQCDHFISFQFRADDQDKVARKAVITGATNIVLGGKSIIQSGQLESISAIQCLSAQEEKKSRTDN
jgi:hypothetical protein